MNTKHAKILIVDDDQDDQFMLKKIFKTILPDAEIDQAYNGAECIDYLESHSENFPDIITMDLNMPLINGIEATAQIKKNARLKHIPIIILTTSDRDNDKKNALESGANDFFIKPVVYDELKTAIHEIAEKWLKSSV